MDTLRFITAGSVDDGKSTLIGRLLFDTKSLFDDTIENLEEYNERRGLTGLDLALVTDGLRSEREQGITIDVAYRYFSTPKRKFVIADTPGHEQYTRNMVTGASNADLAIILIDATLGVQVQSRRHGFLASLLGIPHIIVAVNKMDLVGYSQQVFQEIVEEFTEFCDRLTLPDLVFIPISALEGENVVTVGMSMPWFDGPSILHHLETVRVTPLGNRIDFRLPIQTVVRPHQEFRGYAGQIASGSIREGEEILVLPSRKKSRIRELYHLDRKVASAETGSSVLVTLDDDIDVGRGNLIVRPGNLPTVSQELEATLCWMDDRRTLTEGAQYILQHTTHKTPAVVEKIRYEVSVNTLHRVSVSELGLNQIGRVKIRTAEPVYYDDYRTNRTTGGFILIDPTTFTTVAAGLLKVQNTEKSDQHQSPDVVWDSSGVTKELRRAKLGHNPLVVWMTGLSGSGKSTLAGLVERRLFDEGNSVVRLDGDNLRHGLCGDLGFTEEDRHENLRRAGHTARLLFDYGHIVLCTFISPFQSDRLLIRGLFDAGDFVEVFVKVPLAVCEGRDPKGLYKKARRGEVRFMTGIDSPYEVPLAPELVIDTKDSSALEGADMLHQYIIKLVGK